MDGNVTETFSQILSTVANRYSFEAFEHKGEEQWPSAAGEYLHAMITFLGDYRGVISLTMPNALCGEMATNVLGLSRSDITSPFEEKAFKQFALIVCSELIVSKLGETCSCEITMPKICRVDSGKWRELSADTHGRVRMWMGRKPLLGTLLLERRDQ